MTWGGWSGAYQRKPRYWLCCSHLRKNCPQGGEFAPAWGGEVPRAPQKSKFYSPPLESAPLHLSKLIPHLHMQVHTTIPLGTSHRFSFVAPAPAVCCCSVGTRPPAASIPCTQGSGSRRLRLRRLWLRWQLQSAAGGGVVAARVPVAHASFHLRDPAVVGPTCNS